MDIGSSAKIFNDLHKDDLCFIYSGSISDTITHKMIELTQFNIDSAGNFVKLKNKISFLMAECYQNVVRHGKTTEEGSASISDKSSAFFVRSVGNLFFITSVNSVKNEDINVIKEKLDSVNSLAPDDLKALQKQVLAKGKFSEKGGAGLGIIEMARKTGRKIKYDFKNLDDENSLFYLQLELSNQDAIEGTNEEEISLDLIKSLHTLVISENVLILHKGDFAEHSVLPVIQMIEKNLHKDSESKTGKQRLYNVSVELLQNISMHAFKDKGINEGMFILGKTDDHFYIVATNLIESINTKKLTHQLDKLKQLSHEELNELYREKLKMIIDQDESGSLIGLTYIFRKCHSVNYEITPRGHLSLFSLVVTVKTSSCNTCGS